MNMNGNGRLKMFGVLTLIYSVLAFADKSAASKGSAPVDMKPAVTSGEEEKGEQDITPSVPAPSTETAPAPVLVEKTPAPEPIPLPTQTSEVPATPSLADTTTTANTVTTDATTFATPPLQDLANGAEQEPISIVDTAAAAIKDEDGNTGEKEGTVGAGVVGLEAEVAALALGDKEEGEKGKGKEKEKEKEVDNVSWMLFLTCIYFYSC